MTLRLPGALGEDAQLDSIRSYVNGAEHPGDVEDQLVLHLWTALKDAVNESLPDGVVWLPETCELEHPAGEDPPDVEDVAQAIADSWEQVTGDLPDGVPA